MGVTSTAKFTGRGFVPALPVVVSTGASDAWKVVAANEFGLVDDTLISTEIKPEILTAVAYEDLAANDVVSFVQDGGALKLRKASASSASTAAAGFVRAAFVQGQSARYYVGPLSIGGLVGLSAGSDYFLSTTPGGISMIPPSGSGTIIQRIGVATSSVSMLFFINQAVIIA